MIPLGFKQWIRSVDGPELVLVDWDDSLIEIDVDELPRRPDLLCRLTPTTRARLLWEAREVAKGNPMLDPDFPGYEPPQPADGSTVQ